MSLKHRTACREVQFAGMGYVNFQRDTIDLRFEPQPLKKQLIEVTQPFCIQGSLDHPEVRLEGAPVANALAGALAFPFNILDDIVQPKAGEVEHVPCKVIHTAARQEGTRRKRSARAAVRWASAYSVARRRSAAKASAPFRRSGVKRPNAAPGSAANGRACSAWRGGADALRPELFA